MRSKRRETLLKMVVGAVVGLFVLDRAVISPATASWKAQSERITELSQKVDRGRKLLEREKSLRGRWADMHRTDLPDDVSAAENDVFKSISRWARESRINFTNLNPQWRAHEEEGFVTYECRASAVGDQASLGRLLYEIESDPLPAQLHECELSARDAQGKQVNMSIRFSFVRLSERSGR